MAHKTSLKVFNTTNRIATLAYDFFHLIYGFL